MIKILEQWLADAKQLSALCDHLVEIGFDIESDIVQQSHKCFESLMRQYGERIGDGWHTLQWYWYDNCEGRNGLEAGFDDDVRPIKNLDDLAWFLSGLD